MQKLIAKYQDPTINHILRNIADVLPPKQEELFKFLRHTLNKQELITVRGAITDSNFPAA